MLWKKWEGNPLKDSPQDHVLHSWLQLGTQTASKMEAWVRCSNMKQDGLEQLQIDRLQKEVKKL